MQDKAKEQQQLVEQQQQQQQQQPVTALQDVIAGGIAGSASVVVGHPFDTYKVRLQTSTNMASPTNAASFGGISSLFRGMGPPLSAATVVNALIFSSYGLSSRVWTSFYNNNNDTMNDNNNDNNNDSTSNASKSEPTTWKKAFICGSFAGAVQAFVICPTEHIKCRLQIQHGIGSKDYLFKGPFDALDKIYSSHGVGGLYRGFACTAWREIPAFGLYFATYDYVKDEVTSLLSSKENENDHDNYNDNDTSHTWAISALAGGCSGAFTWAAIYPFDVIKTKIQTMPLDTPIEKRRITYVFNAIRKEYGAQLFFRGLGVTLLRAFPVNAIIFPVYEFTLFELNQRGIGAFKSDEQFVESKM